MTEAEADEIVAWLEDPDYKYSDAEACEIVGVPLEDWLAIKI